MIQVQPSSNNPSRDGADCFIATTTAMIIAAAAAAGGSVAAAKIGSNAASHAGDLQAAANDKTLDFTKQQAEQKWASDEQTRKANYDQWAARQSSIGDFGAQYGLARPSTPAYVPSTDPRFTGGTLGAAAGAPGSTPPSSTAPAAGGAAFIANWQATHPASEGIAPLAAAYKAAGFGDRFLVNGTTPSNNELTVDGAKFKVLSGENGSSPSWYVPGTNDGGGASKPVPGTIGAYAAPTASLVAAPTPYQIFQRGTLGATGRGY
jgi:hypothetical protein